MGVFSIKSLQFLTDRLVWEQETQEVFRQRLYELDDLLPHSLSVVGNASSLLDKAYGREIDSRSTVRFNKAQIVSPEAQGERWDFVATSTKKVLIYYRENIPQFSQLLFTGYKTKLVAALRETGASVPVTIYPMHLSRELSWRLRSRPTVGMQTLYLLAALKRSDVHIFGFDWKATPTFYDPHRKKDPHRHDRERKLALSLIERNGWTIYS
jgi:hypothetical protein